MAPPRPDREGDALDGPSTFCIAAQVHILQHLSFLLYKGDEPIREARHGLLDHMLEITESTAARDAGQFLESIAQLKARGFLLATAFSVQYAERLEPRRHPITPAPGLLPIETTRG
jgi:hypothetical protein